MGHQVFISYSSKNVNMREAVRHELEARGISCWYDQEGLLPGNYYGEKIVQAIRACSILLLVLTEQSNQSKEVASEVELAHRSNKIIVPFRIDNVEYADALAYFLQSKHYMDGYGTPIQDAVKKLADKIEQVLKLEVDSPGTQPAEELERKDPALSARLREELRQIGLSYVSKDTENVKHAGKHFIAQLVERIVDEEQISSAGTSLEEQIEHIEFEKAADRFAMNDLFKLLRTVERLDKQWPSEPLPDRLLKVLEWFENKYEKQLERGADRGDRPKNINHPDSPPKQVTIRTEYTTVFQKDVNAPISIGGNQYFGQGVSDKKESE